MATNSKSFKYVYIQRLIYHSSNGTDTLKFSLDIWITDTQILVLNIKF